jgi:GR25 family glycosyltransferase involved in LPS biosynthesis
MLAQPLKSLTEVQGTEHNSSSRSALSSVSAAKTAILPTSSVRARPVGAAVPSTSPMFVPATAAKAKPLQAATIRSETKGTTIPLQVAKPRNLNPASVPMPTRLWGQVPRPAAAMATLVQRPSSQAPVASAPARVTAAATATAPAPMTQATPVPWKSRPTSGAFTPLVVRGVHPVVKQSQESKTARKQAIESVQATESPAGEEDCSNCEECKRRNRQQEQTSKQAIRIADHDDTETDVETEIEEEKDLLLPPIEDFLSQVPIYVTQLPAQRERQERLSARLHNHGLLEQTTFVAAMTPDSDYVKEMLKDWPEKRGRRRIYAASFYSQLAALKIFCQSSPIETQYALILENDAVLHDEFRDRFNSIWSREMHALDELPHIVLLTCCTSNNRELKAPQVTEHLFQLNDGIWCAQGYAISRPYANYLIEMLDRPIVEVLADHENTGHLLVPELSHSGAPEFDIAWEQVIQASGGYFTLPRLIIEESMDSTMQSQPQIYFNKFRGDFLKNEPADSKMRAAWTNQGGKRGRR